MDSVFTCCQQIGRCYGRGIPSLAPCICTNIKNIGLPGKAMHSVLGIIRHILIMLQPIKSMFFLVYSFIIITPMDIQNNF